MSHLQDDNPFGDDNDTGATAGGAGGGAGAGAARSAAETKANYYDNYDYDDDDRFDFGERETKPADFLIPDAVKEFLKAFCEAVYRGNVHEISKYYEQEWKSYTDRFYATSPWPEVSEIESLVEEDPVFTCMYKLLYYKHLLATLPSKKIEPSLDSYVEAWDTYREFFNLVKDPMYAGVVFTPQWLYDTLSEFIYQFQNFLQLRSKPHLTDEERDQIRDDYFDVWGIVDVLRNLHQLVDASNIKQLLIETDGKELPAGLLPQLGYFSLVCLCRLHSQLGDYNLALSMVDTMNLKSESIFSRVPACHVTLYYYMGFSLMMSRRYVEALKCFGRMLLYFHRTKQAHRKTSQGGIMKKRADQMLALLSICHVLCPGQSLDDQVRSLMRNLYDEQVKAMRAGGAAALPVFEEVFRRACPTFISACADLSADIEASTNETFENQLNLFKAEVDARVSVLPTTRSYLTLYTNIDISKLGSFCGTSADETHMNLVRLRMNMYQNQGGVGKGSTPAWATADPLHFYVDGPTVHVDEVETQNNTNRYFADHIRKFDKVMRDINRSGTKPPPGAKGKGGGKDDADAKGGKGGDNQQRGNQGGKQGGKQGSGSGNKSGGKQGGNKNASWGNKAANRSSGAWGGR